MTRRIIAERIKTGEIVSWDAPLRQGSAVRELSGPGGLTGLISPREQRLLGDDGRPIFEEWATALYYEADGEIRGAGIVVRIGEDEDGALRVEAPGFTTYPHGIPYLGTYRPGLGADPLDTVRHLWDHVQSFPDGDLGLTVDATVSGTILDDTTGDTPQPYRLSWWDNRDCGAEIDAMLEAAPADYVEIHDWSADRSAFTHHLRLGHPRVGRRRHDLHFIEGENVIRAIPYVRDGDDFAQTVIGLGKGEGRKMVRHEVATRDDRLRRVAVVADKGADITRIQALAKREHKRRTAEDHFEVVHVRDHDNARISAITPGDDIFVQANLTWYGRVRRWCRVLAIQESVEDNSIAAVSVAPSSQFTT